MKLAILLFHPKISEGCLLPPDYADSAYAVHLSRYCTEDEHNNIRNNTAVTRISSECECGQSIIWHVCEPRCYELRMYFNARRWNANEFAERELRLRYCVIGARVSTLWSNETILRETDNKCRFNFFECGDVSESSSTTTATTTTVPRANILFSYTQSFEFPI